MKIWMIVSDFPKVTETFALANVQAFRAAGHKADVFHLKPFRSNEVVHPEARDIVDQSFRFAYGAPLTLGRAVLGFVRRPLAVTGAIGQIVRAFWRKPRHLGVSLMLVPQALALGVAARKQGVDHLYAEFAGYPATVAWLAAKVAEVPFGFSAHAHDIFITQGLLAEKADAAAYVRTISEFNRRFLTEKAGVDPKKIHVIRCGVPAARAEGPLPDAPSAGTPFELLFVGALLPRKGVQILLDALAELPSDLDWRLTIIGAGSQEGSLHAQAVGMDRVRFVGAQPSDAVQAAMAKAHLVIVPSIEGAEGRSEGIPVVLMEAMAQGRPVVASRLSGIPELVEDGVTGALSTPGDAGELAARIEAVLRDYSAARDLAAAGQARVRADYDIGRNAAALLELIKRA